MEKFNPCDVCLYSTTKDSKAAMCYRCDLYKLKVTNDKYKSVIGDLAMCENGDVVGFLNGKETKYIEKDVSDVLRDLAVKMAKVEAYKDVENKLRRVIVPKSTWKKFDCYCYSSLTDDLPVENKVVEASDLKARKILSFKKSDDC